MYIACIILINYFFMTVKYSTSFKNFLHNSNCKISKILYAIYAKELTRENFSTSLITAKDINFITYKNDGSISFLPGNKECKLSSNGNWLPDGRQTGKPAKVIRKLFPARALKLLKINEQDFEIFSNEYKAKFNDGLNFEMLAASEIPNVYNMPHAEGYSSLAQSCMANHDTAFFDIYKNCTDLQILILKDNLSIPYFY